MSTTVQVKNSTKHIQLICVTGLFAAMIYVLTAWLHIPTGAGYTHAGDGLIYLAASMLPTPMQWRQALSEQVLQTDFRDLWYGSLELSL